jgi:hypothetical protein
MLKKRTILFLSALFFVVGANVYSSQSFPNLFYDLAYYNKRDAAVEFLQKIEHEDEFQSQYQYLKSIWGNELSTDVFKDALSREKKNTTTIKTS